MLSGLRITRAGIIFVVGIIVLAGLVFGGVMIAKNRGEQVRRDEAVKIAEQTLKDQSEAIATEAVDDTSTTTAGQTGGSTDVIATTGTAPAQLPETGPASDLGRLAIVSILALSVAVYIASRRAVQQG
jgi:FtsZ-interacting cell division protein ZipA